MSILSDFIVDSGKNTYRNPKKYCDCVQYTTLLFIYFITILLLSFVSNSKSYANDDNLKKTVTSQKLVPAVHFYPERTLFLPNPQNQFHARLNNYIMNDFKTDGVRFGVGQVQNRSDYFVDIDYAIGCPMLGENTHCRILVLWNMYRGDNAPVAAWEAYYPLDIPLSYHSQRSFADYQVPDGLIALIGDDFIKSLNYEILKKEEKDKIYVKPDHLENNVSLCSQDAITKFYSNAGLFTTDKAYRARFYVETTVINDKKTGQTTIERLFLDRITGQYIIMPFKTSLPKDFVTKEAYDCVQSANITIQKIGALIANAP